MRTSLDQVTREDGEMSNVQGYDEFGYALGSDVHEIERHTVRRAIRNRDGRVDAAFPHHDYQYKR